MEPGQRGFTLLETTIGAAIAFFVIWSLVTLTDRSVSWATSLHSALTAQSEAARLTERLSSEGSSCWAVFVPATDVLGASNTDGHEIDFFTEDGSHRPYAWAYRYEAATRLLTRYVYAPGVAARTGESYGPFEAFTATAGDIASIASPSAGIYDPLFAGAAAPAVHYSFAAMPQAQGGNNIVAITIRAHGVEQRAIAASATAPTAFTLVMTYTPAPPVATPTPGPLPTLTPTPL